MQKPTLSIIIPVYNDAKSANNILSSILGQEFKDFEIVLVDDGSTDDTLSQLRHTAKQDDRIRVFTKPNGGPSSARNLGLEKAVGKYIQFYDADDDLAPHSLSTIINNVKRFRCDMLVSGWQIDIQFGNKLVKAYKHINPSARKIDHSIKEQALRSLGNGGELYNLWNKLFLADIIRKHNLRFREDLRFGEDLLFSLDFIKQCKKIGIIPDVTYHYKTNSQSSVFSSSSIQPGYRIINDEGLIRFVGEGPDAELFDLMQWLRFRWLVSYWSLVSKSNKNLRAKLALIAEFSPSDLRPARNTKHIGLKKLALEVVVSIAKKSTATALFLGWLFDSAKKVVLKFKLLKIHRQ